METLLCNFFLRLARRRPNDRFTEKRAVRKCFPGTFHYFDRSMVAWRLQLIVCVIVSSCTNTVIKYFVSTSAHASSSRFKKKRLRKLLLPFERFIIYLSCLTISRCSVDIRETMSRDTRQDKIPVPFQKLVVVSDKGL